MSAPNSQTAIEILRKLKAYLETPRHSHLHPDFTAAPMLVDDAIKSLSDGPADTVQFSQVNDPNDWNPKEDFDALTFGSYTDAKKAEVLFNRLQRERDEAKEILAKLGASHD